ncbi:hypothetical protein GCM10011579_067910 [Streptomyces albiflavescens]|uniref:Uncharacterized protein n=1 Tax=Streptomyces albiflavescens TaxID=1623582 RepID=A0A918D7U9_9ACTN|nr:hypothetical protein GCM10011579_067910 [Streptomyces albiflavescens]
MSPYSATGSGGRHQAPVLDGLIVAVFRHYESRSRQPLLHEHALLSEGGFHVGDEVGEGAGVSVAGGKGAAGDEAGAARELGAADAAEKGCGALTVSQAAAHLREGGQAYQDFLRGGAVCIMDALNSDSKTAGRSCLPVPPRTRPLLLAGGGGHTPRVHAVRGLPLRLLRPGRAAVHGGMRCARLCSPCHCAGCGHVRSRGGVFGRASLG